MNLSPAGQTAASAPTIRTDDRQIYVGFRSARPSWDEKKVLRVRAHHLTITVSGGSAKRFDRYPQSNRLRLKVRQHEKNSPDKYIYRRNEKNSVEIIETDESWKNESRRFVTRVSKFLRKYCHERSARRRAFYARLSFFVFLQRPFLKQTVLD